MKLALGTAQFGLNYGISNQSGIIKSEQAARILKDAHLAGIDTLDTAIDYGHSEAALGNLDVRSWKVVSKLPAIPPEYDDLRNWVKFQIKGSLDRLRVTKLHAILLHRPYQLLEDIGPTLYDVLADMKSQGFVCKVGVSVYDPSELDSLFSKYSFDIVQVPLNILDRRFMDSGWISRLHLSGVEIHTRSVFLQGLLLMLPQNRPQIFNQWESIWDQWNHWLMKTNLTPLQACIRYVNSISQIDKIIVGVDSVSQLSEIIEALGDSLDEIPDFGSVIDNRLINPATWRLL